MKTSAILKHVSIHNLGRIHILAAAAIASERQSRSDWAAARAAWTRTIKLANATLFRDKDLLAEFRIRLATNEWFLGLHAEAELNLKLAEALSPQVSAMPEARLLTARLVRGRDRDTALAALRKALRVNRDDTAVLFELCSIYLDSPHPETGSPYAARLLEIEPDNLSFNLVAADLAERSEHWQAARRHLDRLLDLAPTNLDLYIRLLAVLEITGDAKHAKAVACRCARAIPGELIGLQKYMQLQERAGKLASARTICRFLVRQWPHSQWHKLKYAELLARSGRLNAADHELASISSSNREGDVWKAVWSTAQHAGSAQEALDRMDALRNEDSFDLDFELSYGYALADAKGAAVGRAHFKRIAVRSCFHRRAMHGLAHMAIRERVPAATRDAWRRAYEVHPDDAYALREYCRSLLETGQGRVAIELCAASLERFGDDQAYVEFFIWLNTAVGRFKETLRFCRSTLRDFPNSWQALESGMTSAAFLGQVDRFAEEALGGERFVAYQEDVQRAYTLMRLASTVDRESALRHRFSVSDQVRIDHPWLQALALPAAAPEGSVARLDSSATRVKAMTAVVRRPSEHLYRGSRFEQVVGQDAAATFARLDGAQIDDILNGTGRAPRTIQIFSRFEQPRGGSELHALDLAERLSRYAKVELWSPGVCHSSFIESGMVRMVDPANGDIPAPGGVIVLVGLYFDLGPWLASVAPSRIVALYNTFEAPQAMARLDAIHRWTGCRTDLLYCSTMMATELGLPGTFEPSPTDLDIFSPGRPHDGPFTIGRHSRDVVEKHHPEDAAVYRAVAAMNGRSVVLGGLSIRETFGPIDGLDLRPATAKGIPDFLRSLDCYFYRTGTWVEPWGRVVIEALACGVPVVAHRLGGYAEAIENGRNGFLFDETDQAIEQIGRLASDPDLRAWMSTEARASAERVVGPQAMRRLAAYYLFDAKAVEARQDRGAKRAEPRADIVAGWRAPSELGIAAE